jgi:putative transcriptional regulator
LTNRLKVLRAENDWSQARLANELGVSRQTINAIETGKYDPSLPLAFDLARLFHKQIEDIFTPDQAVPERNKREKRLAADVTGDQLPFPDLDVSLM